MIAMDYVISKAEKPKLGQVARLDASRALVAWDSGETSWVPQDSLKVISEDEVWEVREPSGYRP